MNLTKIVICEYLNVKQVITQILIPLAFPYIYVDRSQEYYSILNAKSQ